MFVKPVSKWLLKGYPSCILPRWYYMGNAPALFCKHPGKSHWTNSWDFLRSWQSCHKRCGSNWLFRFWNYHSTAKPLSTGLTTSQSSSITSTISQENCMAFSFLYSLPMCQTDNLSNYSQNGGGLVSLWLVLFNLRLLDPNNSISCKWGTCIDCLM